MKSLENIKISPTASIEKALNILNSGAVKITLVVNNNNELLGTLSDGDIRRALLNKKTLKDNIENVYFRKPITANLSASNDELINLCSIYKVNQIPIISNDNQLIDLFVLDGNFSPKRYDNTVVLMVGGLGRRLMPLTNNTPKPMLKVGNKPILETIIKGFRDSGFFNIVMCIGYKSDVIKEYFQDGSEFGVKIDYIVENKRMGTAGALTLLKKKLSKPFFVMNGDLLTNINFSSMLEFHESNLAQATMCVREYDVEVPYGVVNTSNENITSIEEKPIHSFFVNAGIYFLEPKCIQLIPINEFYDMPSLFETLIKNNEKVVSFPLNEYWIDVGRINDYQKANNDYNNIF